VADPLKPCLLFDIDGTLVDTDKVHIVAFNEVMQRYGVRLDHDTYRHKVSGRMNNEIFADLLPEATVEEHIAVGNEKEAKFRELVGEITPIAGLMELLDWADSVGLRYAAVTNAPRENAELVLRSLNATHRFAALVLADDLDHAKPHPLPYLTGLERLGSSANQSVAFEDSKSGVLSASRAGLGVVGLTTSLDHATLIAHGATISAPDYRNDDLRRFIKDRTGKG
jgi:beta-phosphoglucomutase-like phosphatase (HAD superfamily)